MSAPVISASSSILGFKRNETFAFQPAATNAPSGSTWSAVGLPSGVTINASTGLISGACATTGVYVSTVSVLNIDSPTPLSGSMQFVFGISSETASIISGTSDMSTEWDLDVVTREVSRISQTSTGAAAATTAVEALAFWKEGDKVLLRVRFRKNGLVVDPISRAEGHKDTIKFALKQYEPEAVLVSTAGVQGTDYLVSVGTGESAYYDIPIDLSGTALAAALADNEADAGTFFEALGEIEWTSYISSTLTLRGSSRTFSVRIERDLVS